MKKSKTPTISVSGRSKGRATLWFIFPDIHFGEHDEEAIELTLAAQRMLKPENSLLLGDVLDCGIFSSWAKRMIQEDEAINYKAFEIDPANKMLDTIQEHTKNHTYFLEGNHEQRIERWAANNGRVAQSIYHLISPKATLSKGRKNFTMVPYVPPTGVKRGFVQIVKPSSQMKTGGLVAVHGWSFAKNAARIHLDKSRSQSIVFGHTHRAQLEVSRDPWTGCLIKAFNPGTLSKLESLHAVGGNPSDWSHGFALIYIGRESWTEYMISVVKGRCVLPDGREIRL